MKEQTKQKFINFLKRFWILITFCLVMIIGVFVLISQQPQMDASKKKNNELLSLKNDKEKQCENREGELSNAGSDSYIDSAARDKLGWVKKDELVFKEGDDASTSAVPSKSADTKDNDQE